MMYRVFHYGKSSCMKRSMQNFIIVTERQNVTCKHCLRELGVRNQRVSKARLIIQGVGR